MRLVNAVGGTWSAVARTTVLLGVLGLGVWLLPVDFEIGPVQITHPRCEVLTEVPNQPFVPVPAEPRPAA